MRSRNIKPSFFKNYDLADAGPIAQLLFAGLWCMADREGRLEDKPRFIKAEIFPYYDCDVDGELTVLARLGHIQRYKEQNVDVIQVMNFLRHQSPHRAEKPSNLPACNEVTSCFNWSHEITCKKSALHVITCKKPLIPDSLIPDSLIPDSLIPQQTEEQSVVISSEKKVPDKKQQIVPYNEIVKIYHEECPNLSRCVKLTDKRKALVAKLYSSDIPTLDSWRSYFKEVELSDFLMGRKNNGFRADFEWLINSNNALKVAEGRYSNKQRQRDDISWASDL